MSSNSNFYFIAGSDYHQETEQKRILDSIEDCETEVFSPDEFSLETFFGFINSPSLFQENKAAVIRSADKIKNLAEIVEKCKNCMESTLIVCSENTKPNKELAKALKESGFEQVIEKTAKKFDQTGQILQMFTTAGFSIDSSSAMEINEIFEGNMKQVANEIEKLTIYFAYKKPKSTMEIMQAITARKQDSIFTFIDAYTARSRKTCTVLMNSFIESGENTGIIINLLFKRMRDLYMFCNMKENLTEKRPWMLDKIKTGAKSWSKEDLIKLFDLYAELDYKNKTGQINQRDYFIRLVSFL